MAGERNTNLNSGNYNEHIEGSYIQGNYYTSVSNKGQDDMSPRRTFTAEVDDNIFKLEYIRIPAHFLDFNVFLDGVTQLKFKINEIHIVSERITWGKIRIGPEKFDCITYREKREFSLDIHIKWNSIIVKLVVKDKKGKNEKYEFKELVTRLK